MQKDNNKIEIDKSEYKRLFNLKSLYACFDSKLFECLITEKDYDNLFDKSKNGGSFHLLNSMIDKAFNIRGSSSNPQSQAIYGGDVINNSFCELELLPSLSSVLSDLKIGNPNTRELLEKVMKNPNDNTSMKELYEKNVFLLPKLVQVSTKIKNVKNSRDFLLFKKTQTFFEKSNAKDECIKETEFELSFYKLPFINYDIFENINVLTIPYYLSDKFCSHKIELKNNTLILSDSKFSNKTALIDHEVKLAEKEAKKWLNLKMESTALVAKVRF